VHQPIKQIGHDAAELLIALIGQDPHSADAPRQVTAPHHLVSRESTGVPPTF
jgi:DNA-binding LacI/PurR family transcriptional regulator